MLQDLIFCNMLFDARSIYFQIDPRNVQESDGDFVTISARVTLERRKEKEKQRKKVVSFLVIWAGQN